MIQRIVGASLLVGFLLALPIAAQSKDINIGWSGIGSWTTLPYVVANEKGFFDREGLKVQLITFRGTNLMLTALLAGELDYVTILPFLTGAAARGLPVKNRWRSYQEQLLRHDFAARDR